MKRVIGLGMAVGIVAAFALVSGCQGGAETRDALAAEEGEVDVYIYPDPDGEPKHKTVGIKGSATVLEVTRRTTSVRTQTTANGEEWVVRMKGKEGDLRTGKLWSYQLNSSLPTEAPNFKHVGPGDVVIWRFE